jgi:hypothetical protein
LAKKYNCNQATQEKQEEDDWITLESLICGDTQEVTGKNNGDKPQMNSEGIVAKIIREAGGCQEQGTGAEWIGYTHINKGNYQQRDVK